MKKIKSIIEPSGDQIDIYWQDNLVNCPALSLFLKVYAETIEKGFSNPVMTWSNKNRIAWAQRGEKIVGGIAYEYAADSKMGWIILSFTIEDERGKGINGYLYPVIEEDVKKLGGERMSSLCHVDNTSMHKAYERRGMKPQFYRMNKMI